MPVKYDYERHFLRSNELYEMGQNWYKDVPEVVEFYGIDFGDSFYVQFAQEIAMTREGIRQWEDVQKNQ